MMKWGNAVTEKGVQLQENAPIWLEKDAQDSIPPYNTSWIFHGNEQLEHPGTSLKDSYLPQLNKRLTLNTHGKSGQIDHVNLPQSCLSPSGSESSSFYKSSPISTKSDSSSVFRRALPQSPAPLLGVAQYTNLDCSDHPACLDYSEQGWVSDTCSWTSASSQEQCTTFWHDEQDVVDACRSETEVEGTCSRVHLHNIAPSLHPWINGISGISSSLASRSVSATQPENVEAELASLHCEPVVQNIDTSDSHRSSMHHMYSMYEKTSCDGFVSKLSNIDANINKQNVKVSIGRPYNPSQALCEGERHAKNATSAAHVTQHASLKTCSSIKCQLPAQPSVMPSYHSVTASTYMQDAIHVKPLSPKRTAQITPLYGCLRFLEQGGSLCFTFFVNNSDEVFFARAYKLGKQSSKQKCDWMYMFHSRKDKAKVAWKDWLRTDKPASDLVGKMKVSTNLTKCKRETQFILFREQLSATQGVTAHRVSKCPKRVVETSRLAIDVPCIPSQQTIQRAQYDSSNAVLSPCKGDIGEALKLRNCPTKASSCNRETTNSKPCPSNDGAGLIDSELNQNKVHPLYMEIAAIVIISTLVNDSKPMVKQTTEHTKKDAAGWGLKFLSKGSGNGWGLKFLDKSHFKLETGDHASLVKNNVASVEKKKPIKTKDEHAKTMVDITVVLPTAVHGLPMDGLQGPTPLVERLQWGGSCDCGGWDEGCGISVLKTEPLMVSGQGAHIALTYPDRINWLSPENPLKIFTQGYKRNKVLVLEVVQAGLFSLRFQSCFSPLQAFATAVAMFHQQILQT